jgi:hypothetical protein
VIFGIDIQFWLTVAGAVAVKLITSKYEGFWRALAAIFAAMFSAWVFTNPVLNWTALDPETYRYFIAALAALTGEGIMKWIIAASNEPTKIIDLIRQWRAGK